MTYSAATLTPGMSTVDIPGVGAVAEKFPVASADHLRRAGSEYGWWLRHVLPAASCSNPVRLRVEAQWLNESGQVIEHEHVSADMPDGVLYVACKNRRASVCPGCSQTYRADMYQLIRAGLLGGKGVPASVTRHPCLFVTFTAPSFGLVHSAGKPGHPQPCTPRRNAGRCPHGVALVCWDQHAHDDTRVGEPLCRDCYDYEHQAVWNLHAGELWRRTTIAVNRDLTSHAKVLETHARLQYAKVAEYQRRGAVHFHALIRLDGFDPQDRDTIHEPHPGITADHVRSYIETAAQHTAFTTDRHPHNRDGWPITWGAQLDVRIVHLTAEDLADDGAITSTAVAGYLAKYATKATEDTGYTSKRLTGPAVELLAENDTHQIRQVVTCWYLGECPPMITRAAEREVWEEGKGTMPGWGRLQRWAHMLGYGGHFATKSRRYSTTLRALREVRAAYQRGEQPQAPEQREPLDHDTDGEQAAVIVAHIIDGLGWLTTADAQLANTAAAKAREYRRIAREEIESAM